MTMTDDDLDLSAWEAPEPRPDLADAVLARMAGTQVVEHVGPVAKRRRALLIAGVAAATLAAAAAVVVIVRGTERATPASGRVVAERAQTLALGGVRAELDAGARVTWRREGGALHVEQAAGAAAWRVSGDERLVIDAGAAVASVEATGASLRVEVKMNQADMRVVGVSALTAAAVAMVTVTVYEGRVKVAGSPGQATVIVQPGSTYTVTPPATPVTPVTSAQPVVGAGTYDATKPTSADLRMPAGESATIHVTAAPVRVELDAGRSDCRTSVDDEDVESTIVELAIGMHPYVVACGTSKPYTGTLVVIDDVGRTELAKGAMFELEDGPLVAGRVVDGTCVTALGMDVPVIDGRFKVVTPGPVKLSHALLGVHYLIPMQTTKTKTKRTTKSERAAADESIPADKGKLRIEAMPAARLWVDGADTGKTTPAELVLAAGKHKVTFAIGDDRFTYPVNIVGGQSAIMIKDLR
jgi:ferric-dicitrate binding protein FerR (iron transport regulator)